MKTLLGVARKSRYRSVFMALGLSNLLSIGLFLARASEASSNRYWFLIWNLVLAWVPLMMAFWLKLYLRRNSWLSVGSILITLLWLGFLPNSFYLVSDLIHLHVTGEVSLLYDVVMFFSFIFNAYVVGFMSLFIIHKELLRRVRRNDAHIVIGGVFLLCGIAIYLGRFMRWNTWDVLVNPAGVLFDVSDKIINPAADPQAFVTTVTFFALLGVMYAVIWQIAAALQSKR